MLATSSSAIKTDASAAGRVEPNAARSTQCLCRPGWEAWVRADTLVLSLHGDWSVRSEGSHARTLERLLATRRLVLLLRTEPLSQAAMRARIAMVERVGEWALARWADGAALATLVGEAALRAAPALRGKVRTRAGDLLNLIYSASAAALPIMALVNVLVGAIVALVGSIQLRRLGAEVYVSNCTGRTDPDCRWAAYRREEHPGS